MSMANTSAISMTNSESPSQVFATLRFAGDELDPDEISHVVRQEPTWAYRKGQRYQPGPRSPDITSKTGVWYFSTKRNVPSKDLRDHLDALASLVFPRADEDKRLRELRDIMERRNLQAHVTCFWRGPLGVDQPSIPAVVTEALGRLPADIERISQTSIPKSRSSRAPHLEGGAASPRHRLSVLSRVLGGQCCSTRPSHLGPAIELRRLAKSRGSIGTMNVTIVGVVCWSRYSVGRCLSSPATGLTSKRYSIALRLWRSCPAPIPPTYGFPVAGFMGRVSRSGFGSNQTWLDRADVKRNGLSPLAAGVFGGSV